MQKHTSFFQKKIVRISILALTGILVLTGVMSIAKNSDVLAGSLTRAKTVWQKPSTKPTSTPIRPNPECIRRCERCVYTKNNNPQYCEKAIRECKARC